jgi:hypothetical protein
VKKRAANNKTMMRMTEKMRSLNTAIAMREVDGSIQTRIC